MKDIYFIALLMLAMALLVAGIYLYNNSPKNISGKVINYTSVNSLSVLKLNTGGIIEAGVAWNGTANIIAGENCSIVTGWWLKLERLNCSK